MKKAPDLSTWGFLIKSGARRRLNLELMCQFLKGFVFCAFPRDTPGDTRRSLLGRFLARCTLAEKVVEVRCSIPDER